MALQDIQLQIIVGLQGASNLQAVNTQLGQTAQLNTGVANSAKAMTETNWRNIRSWDQLVTQLKHAETRYDAVFRAGVRMQQVGYQLNDLGRRGINILRVASESWGDYEFQIEKAGAALSATGVWQDRLSEGTQDLAARLGLYKPDEVAKAVYYWGSASGDVVNTQDKLNAVLKATETILMANASAGGSYEQAIKGVYSILTQYNLGTEDAARVTEILHLMTMRTSLEFSDLIQSFKYVGPLANELGVSFETVAQLMGVLGDLGIRGSMSGRGFSMALQSIISPTTKAKGALDNLFKAQFGVNDGFDRMVFPKGEFVGLAKYIDILADSMEGLTDQQRQKILADVYTNNGARIMIPLVAKQIELRKENKNVLDQEKYSLIGASQIFQETYERLRSSWKGLTGQLRNTFMPIVYLIGQQVATILQPWIDHLKIVGERLREFLKQRPGLVDFITKVLAIGSALAIAAGAFFTVMGAVLLFAAGLGVVKGGLMTITAPVMTLMAVLGAAAAAIAANVGGIRTSLQRIINTITDIFREASRDMSGFRNQVASVFTWIRGFITSVFSFIAGVIDRANEALKKLDADPQGHQVLQAIAKALIAVATVLPLLATAGGALGALGVGFAGLRIALPILSGIALGLSGITGAIGALQLVQKAIAAFGVFLMANPLVIAIAAIVALVVGLWYAWEHNIGGIREIVAGLVQFFTGTILPAIQSFIADIVAGIGQLVTSGVGLFNNFVGFLSGVVNQIVAFIQRLAQPFVDLFTRAWPGIQAGVQRVWEVISGFINEIWTVVQDVFNNKIMPAISGVADQAVAVWNTAVELLGPTFDSLVSFVGMLGSKIAEFVGWLSEFFLPIWDVVATVVGTAIGAVAKVITEVFLWLVPNIIQPFVTTVIQLFGVLFETLAGIVRGGLQIIQGIIQIVLGVIKGIFDFFTAILKGDWKGAWEAIKNTVSTVFEGILNIVRGVLTIVLSVVRGILDTVVTVFRGAFEIALNVVRTVFELILQAIRTTFDIIVGVVRGAVNLVVEVIRTILNTAVGIVRGIFEGILGVARTVWDTIKGAITGVVNGIVTAVKTTLDTLVGTVRDIFNRIVETIRGFFETLFNVGVSMIQNIINGAKSLFTNLLNIGRDLVQKVLDGIANVATSIFNAGKAIVTGLWDGLMAAKDWIIGKVRDFIFSIIPGPIRDILGIRSPSRVMAEIGVQIIEGLAGGIESNKRAEEAMVKKAKKLGSMAKLAFGVDDFGFESIGLPVSATNGVTVIGEKRSKIDINLTVTSPDGSVSKLETSDLARMLNGDDLVRALERMAAVD